MHFVYEFRRHPSWTVSRGLRIFVKHFGTYACCSFKLVPLILTVKLMKRLHYCLKEDNKHVVTIFRLANTSLYQVYEEKARINRNIYAVKASKTMNGSCINGELVGWGYSEKSR